MRAYRRLSVHLAKREREELRHLLRQGIQRVRTVLRALALPQLDAGQTAAAVAANLQLTVKAGREIGRRHEDGGIERALYDKQRPGAAPLLGTSQKQRIILKTAVAHWRGRQAPDPSWFSTAAHFTRWVTTAIAASTCGSRGKLIGACFECRF